MLAEFRDLERKHQMIKEQYEAEIMRLKGQTQPNAAAVHSPMQPHSATQLPNPLSQKRRDPAQSTPYSPNMQSDQHGLPTMFTSRPPPHHPQQQPTLSPTAQQQSNQQTTPSIPQPIQLSQQNSSHQGPQQASPRNHPGPQPQPQPPIQTQSNHTSVQPSNQQPASSIRGMGFSSMPLSQPSNATGIPPLTGGPNLPMNRSTTTGPPGLLAKMPSMNLMPPNGNTPRETNPFTHGPKKEGGMALGSSLSGPGLGNTTNNASFAPVTHRVIGPSGPGSHQPPNQGEDWAVYQGRSPNGSQVTMKVNLQSSLSLESVVCCVRYSWDGQFLATGSNRSAHIFDANSGQLAATFSKDPGSDRDDGSGTDSYVRAVCFSPDGKWLVTGAEDHVVKVWDVRTRKVKHLLRGHDTDIYSVDTSANGQFIISGSGDKMAKLWSLETGKLLSTLGGDQGPTDGITSVSVSPTSQHVAAGSLDKVVRVWDVETCRLVRQFDGHLDSVYSVAFSPDGRMVLSGSLDKTLKLWDLAPQQPSNQCRLTFPGHKDFVLSVAFSPNGRWLISGSKDRSVQFWDPRQSAMCLMLHGHKNSVISIAHNPMSKALATGSGDYRARTWVYT